jgi:probable HAF family extracellular repeat protein
MKFTKLTFITALAALTAFMGLASLPASAQTRATHKARYTVTDLGTLGGTYVDATGISNTGWIAGDSTLYGDNVIRAYLWRNGVMTDLGTLGGPDSDFLLGPNLFGDASGYSELSVADPNQEDFCGFGTGLACIAFFWHHGAMHALPTLGGTNAAAGGTNNLGESAGVAENTIQEPTCAGTGRVLQYKPVIWNQGRIHELPTSDHDPVGLAYAINDFGAAVGQTGPCGTEDLGGSGHAVLWKKGKAIDLGNLGGTTNNVAQNINNAGQVVGYSGLSGDATFHAFVWQRGVMTDLGTLPGDFHSVAESSNIWGEVVGRSSDADFNGRGVVWQNGVPADLNTLIPANSSLYIDEATSNNDLGWIVASATDIDGNNHAVLLIPANGAALAEAFDNVPRRVIKWSAAAPNLLRTRGKRLAFQSRAR